MTNASITTWERRDYQAERQREVSYQRAASILKVSVAVALVGMLLEWAAVNPTFGF